MNILLILSAVAAAIAIALAISPALLRATKDKYRDRRVRFRSRMMRGIAAPETEVTMRRWSPAAESIIAGRSTCFAALACLIAFGALLSPACLGAAAVAHGPLILIKRSLPADYKFMNAVRRQASANPTLTNYAVGLAQDMQSALAEFLAPTVEVPSTVGQYKRFDDKNAFQVYETSRPIGGRATRIEFESTDPTYNCQPQALEVPVDDAERDAADADDPIRLDESKIKTLISSTTLSHEVKVVEKTIGAVPAVAGKGVWSDPDVDPVAELDEQIEAISNEAGMLPNRIAIGIGAWRAFRNHPKVIARQPGAALIGLTPAQASAMLLNPAIDIRVGVLSKDTTKFGKAKNAVNIVGAKLLIFIASPNPTQYDPSFAKTFMGRRGGVTSVRTYREEGARSDIHAVDWSEDIQVTGTACGKRVDVS
jgi:hypothetical protein